MRSLTTCLPIATIPIGHWPHLESLQLADPEFNVSKPIDVLLEVNEYHVGLRPKGTPAAQESIFGWVLFGNTNQNQPISDVSIFHASTS